MAEQIKTSAHKLREGASFTQKSVEIRFPPTGHLSVELRDASGRIPLVKRSVKFDIPELGNVEKTTDEHGRFFQPDVPFADYELMVEAAGKVRVPAVASRNERHTVLVPGAKLGWVDLEILDHRGLPVRDAELVIGDSSLQTDGSGLASLKSPLPKNGTTVTIGDQDVDVELPGSPRRTIVRLHKPKDPT